MADIALGNRQEMDAAVAEFREAIRLKPDLFDGHVYLGKALEAQGNPRGASEEFRRAVRISPDNADGHIALGCVLEELDELHAAVVELSAALRLEPSNAFAHSALGGAYQEQGKLSQAIEQFRKAAALTPEDPDVHSELAGVLTQQGNLDEAIADLKTAIGLDPDDARAHADIFYAFTRAGKVEEGVAELKKAIRLDSSLAEVHGIFAEVLYEQGKLNEAIDEAKRAIELKPDLAEAHCILGIALLHESRFAVAVQAFERGHQRGSKGTERLWHSAEWLARARSCVAIEPLIPAILAGTDRPKSPEEYVAMAGICNYKRLYARSARFWTNAFAASPALAEDYVAGNRYSAACSAALAAAGHDQDQLKLDDAARAELRHKALKWLKADLSHWSKQARRDDPAVKCEVRQALEYWKADRDLSGIRGADGLKKLPAGDQKAFAALWSEVDAILAKVRADLVSTEQAHAVHEQEPRQLPPLESAGTDEPRKPDGASGGPHRAIGLEHDAAEDHLARGIALANQNELHAAIAELRKAIRLKPDLFQGHCYLGMALGKRGDSRAAVKEFRQAVRIKPDDPDAHWALGSTLGHLGELDEAIVELETTLRLDPSHVGGHIALGEALQAQRNSPQAAEQYRKAISLDPNDPVALLRQSRFAQAAQALERGHELASKNNKWSSSSAGSLALARSCAALEPRIPAILAGTDRPASAQENATIAAVCVLKGLYVKSVRFRNEAFAALAEDYVMGNRFNAACCAALAAGDQGEDREKLDDAARAGLRQKALEWLKVDLVHWAKQAKTDDTAVRCEASTALAYWKVDRDLAAIRDEDALKKLPADEQKALRALWSELDAILGRIRNAPVIVSRNRPG